MEMITYRGVLRTDGGGENAHSKASRCSEELEQTRFDMVVLQLLVLHHSW